MHVRDRAAGGKTYVRCDVSSSEEVRPYVGVGRKGMPGIAELARRSLAWANLHVAGNSQEQSSPSPSPCQALFFSSQLLFRLFAMNLFRLFGVSFNSPILLHRSTLNDVSGFQGICPTWRPYLFCCRRFSQPGHVEVSSWFSLATLEARAMVSWSRRMANAAGKTRRV